MEMEENPESKPVVVKLKPIEITPESFQEFGQVIEAFPDDEKFGPKDAQLDLSKGIPRLWILRLVDQPLKFATITHHASVTQCLGAIGGQVWYLGVAKPSMVESKETMNENGEAPFLSHCGHFYLPPAADDVKVFRISGSKFLKLSAGTWHAGPLFKEHSMDFYNLELSNTNEVDHTRYSFKKKDRVVFAIDD